MCRLQFGFDKLARAVGKLSPVSAENINERLDGAASHLAMVGEENLPEELWRDFERLRARITRIAPRPRKSHLSGLIGRPINEVDALLFFTQIFSFSRRLDDWREKNLRGYKNF